MRDQGSDSPGLSGIKERFTQTNPILNLVRGRDSEEWNPVVYGAIILSLMLVFVIDIYTPLGVAVWIFYLLPVVLTLFIWRPWIPPAVALLVTAVILAGYEVSPSSPVAGMHKLAAINRSFGVVTVWLMAAIGYYFIQNKVLVRRQNWLQSGQTALSKVVSGEQSMNQLGDHILGFLAEYTGAHAGAFFGRNGNGFQRLAAYGVASTSDMITRFESGDGLLGQAVKDGRTVLVNDVPDGYLTIGSSLRQGKPRYLVIAPISADGMVNSVVELGYIHAYDKAIPELLERVSNSLGVAIRSAHYRTHLQDLLEETQRQGEELQTQTEELRVSNEELDLQSRALQDAQTRLQHEQGELEETNSQLEEQTHQLELQKEELIRATERLTKQARELEQASQYKSDFLSNMSHELRTPLNASLILAKLLANNSHGNLTPEQVQFAQTIHGAGNDLLMLINDILDLSKIEAGRMDVRPERLKVGRFVEEIVRLFEPVAREKGLEFSNTIHPDSPEIIQTDRQRLEQILKNLLSNAFKFTEKGEVSFRFIRTPEGRVAFTVSDTGIGIAKHQQEMVFEAFRQADGTTNRKYGGTGLGLSISRELTRLLGGELLLESESGRGSVFTVLLPEIYDEGKVRPRAVSLGQLRTAADPGSGAPDSDGQHRFDGQQSADGYRTPAKPAPVQPLRWIEDDRDKLIAKSRVILVVEDDEVFAKILANLAHEFNFQCIIATTCGEAIGLATEYLPCAVLLDLGLPDHSGLTVLDRLKHDVRTRHIPVHVVSASDNSERAFALGALGYMLKPVEREMLIEALKRLETRLAQPMQRVLVVESDPVQMQAIRSLLNMEKVETVGVGTAAECLEHLKSSTYDCMVLDLSLPDATGDTVLETLSREEAYSFPPVIVYTGRELTADDEQRLRRYSKSIIIKGAKSPERLLDEVSLFLHQVVSELPPAHQKMLEKARSRDSFLEGRRILVVEDDVRNVFAVTSVLEGTGVTVQIARNGREALEVLEKSLADPSRRIDLVLMDVMMPEMDGVTATRELRKRPEWRKLPIIMLTAKAMPDDQEVCLAAGANDYLAKPLDVEKLLSLIRVWMPR